MTTRLEYLIPWWSILSIMLGTAALAVLVTLLFTSGIDVLMGAALLAFGIGLTASPLGFLWQIEKEQQNDRTENA